MIGGMNGRRRCHLFKLGLRKELADVGRSGRRPTPVQRRRFPYSKAATCLARRNRHWQDRCVRVADAAADWAGQTLAAPDLRPRARSDARARDAGKRSTICGVGSRAAAPKCQQISALRRGAHVVATPGRALDHMRVRRYARWLDRVDPRRGRRDARHGFCQDLDAILKRPRDTTDGALLGDVPSRIWRCRTAQVGAGDHRARKPPPARSRVSGRLPHRQPRANRRWRAFSIWKIPPWCFAAPGWRSVAGRNSKAAARARRCTAAWSSASVIGDGVVSRQSRCDRDRRRGAQPRHRAPDARRQLRRPGLAEATASEDRPSGTWQDGDHTGRAAEPPCG